MALYEWQDGKIGNVCVQGGARPEPYPAASVTRRWRARQAAPMHSIAKQ